MLDKQVYELTEEDFSSCSGWFFPMDDSVEDELTVRPILGPETCSDAQIVVRTIFLGVDGSRYVGYVYWDVGGGVEYLKPVLFFGDGVAVSFWNGMVKPSWDDYPLNVQNLKSLFPLSYISEPFFDLPSINGTLAGLYYLEGENVLFVE